MREHLPGGRFLLPEDVETAWRSWLECKGLVVVYKQLDGNGFKDETMRVLARGRAADFVFDVKKFEALFTDFLRETGIDAHFIGFDQ